MDRYQREAGQGARVLASERLGLGHPEVLRSQDTALDLDEYPVAFGGAGADVVARIVMRHFLGDAAEAAFGGQDGVDGAAFGQCGVAGDPCGVRGAAEQLVEQALGDDQRGGGDDRWPSDQFLVQV